MDQLCIPGHKPFSDLHRYGRKVQLSVQSSVSQSKTKVLFAASEAAPLVKVGGLGDVAGSLPYALKNLSSHVTNPIDIRIVLPFHQSLRKKYPSPKEIAIFNIPHIDGPINAAAYELTLNGLTYYLIDGEPIQYSSDVYSTDLAQDAQKYVFFSLAILEMARQIKWIPDILHANDWHVSAAIYAMHTSRRFTADFFNTRSVLSIHNLPFMGATAESALQDFNLAQCNDSRLPEWGCKQPLPLAILTANHIVTVSPTYAQEILTPKFGCGLESILTSRKENVSGILNGLDVETWNPATDQALPVQYSWDSLDIRKINKTALQQEFSFPSDPEIPLLIVISRLFHQKGIDMVVDGLRRIIDLPWQAVILGTGEPELEQDCRQMEIDFPERVRAVIKFDLSLSQRMYGGADMLLMPSRYEPCGLSQMIAMRYGCVPIARTTGGLKDTIKDNPRKILANSGFLFTKESGKELAKTIKRALITFQDKDLWQKIQFNGMRQDFSWTRSAMQYASIYQNLRKDVV